MGMTTWAESRQTPPKPEEPSSELVRALTNPEIPDLNDWKDACRLLGGPKRPISRSTLDRLTKSGVLRCRRPAPGVVRWATEDIAEYLQTVSFPRKAQRAAA